MLQCENSFVGDSILLFVIHQQNHPPRGKISEIVHLNSPLSFRSKVKRQVLDHYLPDMSNITSHYGIFTIEILPPQSPNQPSHRIQTDDIELDFSEDFTEYIKNIKHRNLQRANSIFAIDVFSKIYSYVSSLCIITTNISTFSTTRNSVSDSESTTIQKLQNLRD